MNVNPPIVVGVDGSAPSNAAVRWATAEALRRGAPLRLVTTLFVPGTYGVPVGMPPAFFDEEESVGRRRLSSARALADEAAAGGDLVVDTEELAGPASYALLENARDAGMLVIGSRGLGEFTGGLAGSVGSTVVGHAECPVVVVRGTTDDDTDPPRPVVVGVDGSQNSEPAIAEAFAEASLREVGLVAVHAWSDVRLPVHIPGGVDWEATRVREELALAESLAGYGEKFPDVDVSRVVVQDRPVETLVGWSSRARLVVVGSRGRGGFRSLLLGSTSRALVRESQCPVMVVRA